ncbi:MAG: carboxypeptidase-like regulatory domain-containing protein, partial [bacterium]|nr:carboxypeptidase-like regulatory domain-containing protein [bacterium]
MTETTNASGEATVKDLTAGDHTITVTATVGGKELSESASVNIEAKEYSMSLLCQVDGSTITCSVKDQDQEPVNGAAIVAQGTEVTTTGSDGTAKFQAKKPGDVKVRARAKFEGKNIWSEEVTVTIEEQDLSIRINLPRAMDADGVKNDVSGVVTTSGTGIQAEVTCGDESTNTNSGGEFVFNNLKPGTYKIIAEAEVKGIPAKAEDEVTIGSIKLDIMAMAQDLDGKGGRNDATVTLKYGTGSPVPGASVTIGQRNKSTNSEGACQFFNLPPGDHGVAAKISVAGQEIQATTSVSIEEYKLSIILQEPASLDGDNILNDLTVAVQDGMGQGVAGAQVKCGSKSGTTGSGGTVVLRGLDGGPQTISAELTIGSTTFKATESVEISKDVKIFEPVIPADLDGDNLENDVKVTVVNSRGQGISGARVRSDDDRSGVTGSDGSAVLTKLTIGNRSVSARVTIGSATATAPAVSFEVGDKIPPVVTMQPITQDPDTGMTFVLVNPAGQDLPEPKSYDVEISVIGAVDNQRADLLVDGTKAVTQSPISGGKLSAQIYFDIKPKDHLMEIQTEKLAPFKVAVKGSINDNRGPISYRLLLDGVVQEEKRNVAGNSITIERELTITKGVKNTIVLEAHDSNPQNKVRDSVEFVALGDKKYTEKFIVP